MKQRKPIYYVILTSTLLSVLLGALLVALHVMFGILTWWWISGIVVFTGLLSSFIFYTVLERFVNRRIAVLYRTIRKGKFVGQAPPEFKLTEEVFEQVEQEAQQWVEEKQSEISKLKEQEAFRREFLGNLAHELKTPVFSIQGYILTLLDGGLEDETVNRTFLERASVSIDRLVNLLEDLDSITKMEVDGVRMEMENYDIRDSVQEVFDSLELKAKEKQITLKFSKDYQAMPVHADRSKIEQVLTNLIANSIYYGNQGGTTSVRFFEMNELILIEISDDGPGIDPGDLPRIFERFYRVEKSRNRNAGGSGLGLAIAKHIIESHGQTLTVRSSVGLGSTFAFSLDKARNVQESLLSSRGVKIR